MSFVSDRLDRLVATFGAAGEVIGRSLDLGARRFGRRADLAVSRVIETLDARSRGSRIDLVQLQPVQISTWSFDSVRAALEEHELGLYLQSSALMDAFGRDDRISSCLNTRVNALVGKSGAKFAIKPSERGKPALAQELADRVSEWWQYGMPATTVAKLHRDAVMLGVAFARIHWDRVNGERIPRLEPWDAFATYYNWGTRHYYALSQEGQWMMEPGDGEWFVFEPAGRRSWMAGGVRALGIPYVFRGFTQRDWSRYCEKHGIPILAIKEPQGAQWNSQKASFYKKVQRLGKEAVLRLPQNEKGEGFGLDIIEPKDTSWEAFKEFLLRLDINIAVFMLGQNLTTEAGTNGGSHAAVQGADQVRLDYLCADATALSTACREQIVKPWMGFNVKVDDEEIAPHPDWQTEADADKSQTATVLFTFGQAVAQLTTPQAQSAVRVNLPEMARELGIEVYDQQPTAEDTAAAAQAAGAAATAGPPGAGGAAPPGGGAPPGGNGGKVGGQPPPGGKGTTPALPAGAKKKVAPGGAGDDTPYAGTKDKAPGTNLKKDGEVTATVDVEDAEQLAARANAHRAAHAVGVRAHQAADAVAAEAKTHAAQALGPLLGKVTAAIESARAAKDPRLALRTELRAIAKQAPPAEFVSLIERATLLAFAMGVKIQTDHRHASTGREGLTIGSGRPYVRGMSETKTESLSDDQARVPAGSPEGGQFAGEGGAARVMIPGNKYPHYDAIRALGGRWNADARVWDIPVDKEAAVRALLPAVHVPVNTDPPRDQYNPRDEYDRPLLK